MAGGSLKGLKGAIIATGIGALVIVIGELVANWDKWRGVIDGSTAALERNKKAIDEINISYETNRRYQETQIELGRIQGDTIEETLEKSRELWRETIKANDAEIKQLDQIIEREKSRSSFLGLGGPNLELIKESEDRKQQLIKESSDLEKERDIQTAQSKVDIIEGTTKNIEAEYNKRNNALDEALKVERAKYIKNGQDTVQLVS